ncbi:MAG: DNA cytosine methyltransferase [Chloroflexi bacterium]|nr:DNA cytosine methyltransferase [Chloroflexota bacterium]
MEIKKTQIPIISLFCGCGGMDIGFEQAGFNTILAIDNNAHAIESFNHNRNSKSGMLGDLSKLSAKDIIEIIDQLPKSNTLKGLIGGPPCQSFSQGNNHQVINDPRHELPFSYASILKALNKKFQLDFFVFENVERLKKGRHKERFERIRNALIDAGFNIFDEELNVVNYGVPQNRRRIIIVGINKTLYPKIDFVFPSGEFTKPLTVKDAIYGLPPPVFYQRSIAGEFPYHPNHWTMQPKSLKFQDPDHLIGRGKSFRRLLWDFPSPTVAYGNNEIHVHPNGDRRLSIFEAMRLQGFPDNYQIHGTLTSQVKQISNAVPPPLAYVLAKRIQEILQLY